MNKKIILTPVALGLVLCGFFALKFFVPGEEKRIAGRLDKLAATASVSYEDGTFNRGLKMERFPGYFSDPARITLHVEKLGEVEIIGKGSLTEYWMEKMPFFKMLEVRFYDKVIEMNPARDLATVELTAKIDFDLRYGNADYLVQEMKFVLKKIEGVWLISNLENVSTFE